MLILAGLAAGALNAIAGGGTFLTFPALVWAGLPPIVANATATFAALPGYLGAAWAFRDTVKTDGRPKLAWLIGTSILGGLIGALLLLITPASVFSGVVPWLLLFATAIFAVGPTLVKRMMAAGFQLSDYATLAVVMLVSIYGGYFNGGLGIMLLAAFGIIGMVDLHRMNGLKNLISAILSVVSVIAFSVAGVIDWGSLIVLGTACAIGGYVGGGLAKRVRNMAMLRAFIIVIGLVMSAAFFAK